MPLWLNSIAHIAAPTSVQAMSGANAFVGAGAAARSMTVSLLKADAAMRQLIAEIRLVLVQPKFLRRHASDRSTLYEIYSDLLQVVLGRLGPECT